MKKNLLTAVTTLLMLSPPSIAQTFDWAFTMATQPRSEAVAVRQDQSHNFYIAFFTDSVTTTISSQVEKRDAAQQIIWQKTIQGDVIISDVEINSQNHPVVIGYFTGTIQVDASFLTGIGSFKTGFIFECDTDGIVLWAHTLNPVADEFTPVDLFIAPNGEIYLTSSLTGATTGACAFHKLDAQGTIIKNEFNANFEVRTFSHILADSAGNVYLSGTCGNLATFDGLASTINASYQNFLIKYDSSFTAQWIICKTYITFDNNNSLGTDGQNLYWVFDDFSSNNDTVRIVKCDYGGQVLNVVDAPLGSAFFPLTSYSIDNSGNSTLVVNVYNRLFIYRYDNAFNITWNDTIYTQTSGFPDYIDVACYDSCFYLAAKYFNDTMPVGSFLLLNPNTGANYPSDIFLTKWSYPLLTFVSAAQQQAKEFMLYPNPAFHSITIGANQPLLKIEVTDVFGKRLLEKTNAANQKSVELDLTGLSNGFYFVNVFTDSGRAVRKFVKQ